MDMAPSSSESNRMVEEGKEGKGEEESLVYAMEMVGGMVAPLALRSAIELGVFDTIARAGGEAAKLSPKPQPCWIVFLASSLLTLSSVALFHTLTLRGSTASPLSPNTTSLMLMVSPSGPPWNCFSTRSSTKPGVN